MSNQQHLKLFLLLLFGSLFIILFTHGGMFVYEQTVLADGTFGDGTKIGPVDVSGLEKSEAEMKLADAAADWDESAGFSLELQPEVRPFTEAVSIDVEASIKSAQHGKSNRPVVILQEKSIEQTAASLNAGNEAFHYNLAKLREQIVEDAALLKSGTYTYNLLSYIDMEKTEKQVVSSATISGLAAEMPFLNEYMKTGEKVTIPPGSSFSVLETYGNKGEPGGKDQYLSTISSVLYRAVAGTNFQVTERHISDTAPDGSLLGYEAKIIPDQLDFVIFNPNSVPYDITFELSEDDLTVDITGIPFVFRYEARQGEKKVYGPKTITHYSSLLTNGEKKVVREGSEGYTIQLLRIERKPSGEMVSEEVLDEDYYPPVHRIEERPLKAGTDSTSNDSGADTDPVKEGDARGSNDDAGQADAGTGSDTDGTPGQTDGETSRDGQPGESGSIWDVPGEIMKGS